VRNHLIGGILLIVGTSIGGGMLALPMAVAAGSYTHSSLLFVFVWLMMMVAALLLLEVNLWFPDGSNLISMARKTLGRSAEVVTWLFYLLLLYTLLSAYTAGGADLISGLQRYLGIPTHPIINRSLFAIIMAAILYFGVYIVDRVNRALMVLKLLLYVVLVVVLLPHVQSVHLWTGNFWQIKSAILVIVTAFGYGSIIPTLRSYFKSDVRLLRLSIIIGSLIPLVCYLIWDFVVEGTVDGNRLLSWSYQGHAVTQLTESLAHLVNSRWFTTATQLFTTLCISTSFLGVGLGLTDFIADGLRVRKQGWALWLVLALTILPPLLVVVINPAIFIPALTFAGFCCIYLLMFLPALMAYRGRYSHTGVAKGYQVAGGKPVVLLVLTVSILLMVYSILQMIPNIRAMVGV
jgi:tyrosine-specific transport protein